MTSDEHYDNAARRILPYVLRRIKTILHEIEDRAANAHGNCQDLVGPTDLIDEYYDNAVIAEVYDRALAALSEVVKNEEQWLAELRAKKETTDAKA